MYVQRGKVRRHTLPVIVQQTLVDWRKDCKLMCLVHAQRLIEKFPSPVVGSVVLPQLPVLLGPQVHQVRREVVVNKELLCGADVVVREAWRVAWN